MRNVIDGLEKDLREAGFKCAVVSTDYLATLEQDLRTALECGDLDRSFYDEIVSRSGLEWDFDPPKTIPHIQSIIMAAEPQPKLRIAFDLPNGKRQVVIPPTYVYDTDNAIARILTEFLSPLGHRVAPAVLPKKLLAVHSGLAKYGKNNITYMDGWGSYFRLAVFFSDIPCSMDRWYELRTMRQCESCVACVRKCPSRAITGDRFLFNGSRCLTFLNEGRSDFPEWVDPAWHNCLVGCMICQDVCPVNGEFTSWSMAHTEFSEDETLEILRENTEDGIRSTTLEKVRQLPGFDDYRSFQRNLRVLLQY